MAAVKPDKDVAFWRFSRGSIRHWAYERELLRNRTGGTPLFHFAAGAGLAIGCAFSGASNRRFRGNDNTNGGKTEPLMAGRIPQAFLDDLLDRVDIVEVVDRRVKLKKSGKNYSARCPFHEEKKRPLSVSARTNSSTTALAAAPGVTPSAS